MISPAPAVYIAAIEDDLVALDLENDGYFCLPGLGRRLIEDGEGRWTATGAAVESALLETGLFHVEPPRAVAPVLSPTVGMVDRQ